MPKSTKDKQSGYNPDMILPTTLQSFPPLLLDLLNRREPCNINAAASVQRESARNEPAVHGPLEQRPRGGVTTRGMYSWKKRPALPATSLLAASWAAPTVSSGWPPAVESA